MNRLDIGTKVILERLIETRLLIMGNSGSGKSYCARVLIEEIGTKCLWFIFDIEGEFVTLREKFDCLIVGEDIPINLKSAHLLPKELLDKNIPTVIDLSNMKKNDRCMYVKKFLEAMMALPKNYWKPCLVIVSEAHSFCGQQEKQESTWAVIDLMTRGRKRGYTGVLDTQRISKLHKDAAAECNNVFVGRTYIDLDIRRAVDILGLSSYKEGLKLRDLNQGEFMGFGEAIEPRHLHEFQVKKSITTHPKVGNRLDVQVMPPTDQIKKALSKITELPKEEEQKLKTEQDLRQEINQLNTKLRTASKGTNDQGEARIREVHEEKLRNAVAVMESNNKELSEELTFFKESIKSIRDTINSIDLRKHNVLPINIQLPKKHDHVLPKNIQITRISGIKPIYKNNTDVNEAPNNNPILRKGAMDMLSWIASVYPQSMSKIRVATLAGFSVKGGTFNTYISELKRNGWITGSDLLTATELGVNNSTIREMPSGEELINLWCRKFRAGAAKLLRLICEAYPNSITKEELGDLSSFSPDGGTFNTYLSELRRNDLIIISDSEITASEDLMK